MASAMRFVILLAASLAMSACVAKPSAHNAMAGEWHVVEIDEEVPDAPAKALVSFAEEEMSASVGCNAIGGPWRIEENRLIAGPLESTERYCAGPLWEQEKAVASLLVAAPTIAYEGGDLVLRSSRHSARLTRVSPPQRDS